MSTVSLDQLRGQVAAWREQTAKYPGDRNAVHNLQALEVQLDMEERRAAEFDRSLAANNARIEAEAEERRKRREKLEREREARQAERDRAEAEALEAKLRAEYTAAAPGDVTDSEWRRVKDDVKHQHRIRQLQAQDEARAVMRDRLKF
jgi:hypothetical protein